MVPMYNEEAIAENSIQTILRYIKELPPVFTILIVNDGSCDSTKNIIENLIRRLNSGSDVQIISYPINKGYGAALRTGMDFAISKGYEYVIFMDSDLTNHPRYIKNFYEKILEGWDYIKATRYRYGGRVEGVCLQYKIMSRIGNFIAGLLSGLPLTDFTNGFRAVKVSLLKKLNLKEDSFLLIMEELYQMKYMTNSICEIPYVLTSRKKGQGKSHFLYSPQTCYRYFAYVLKCFFKKHS